MTTIELRRVTAVGLLVALTVALTAITWYGLLAGAIWGLVLLCAGHTRSVRRRLGPDHVRDGADLRYHLCALGVLYLVPIGVATTFYCLLAAWVESFGGTASTDRLIALQRAFEETSSFFSDNLKLSESVVLGVLVGVHLLTCLLLARGTRHRRPDAGHGWRFRTAHGLHRGTEFYTRYSGPAAAGLATLASFSLFGMHLGVPADDLRLRLKVAQQGYADVTAKVEADLSTRVTSGLYTKVLATFPPSYRDALSEQATIADLADTVRAHAEETRRRYAVGVPAVDAAVREETARRTRLGALDGDLRVESTGRRDLPGDVTPEQIAASRRALADRPGGGGIDLVADGRRKVTLHLEKVVSERILALTRPLTEAVPIMEPLLQAFADAADQVLQDRIGRAYDRLVGVAVRSPQDLDAAVAREAAVIVDQTDVRRAVADATPRAERLAERHRQTLASLRNGPTLIDRKVTETLKARRPPQARPGRPGPLPELRLPELLVPELPPLPRYYPPDLGGYQRPPYTYRPAPRIAPPPPRPVRPVPRIFVW